MIDLFGMRQKDPSEAPAPAAAEPAAAPHAPRGSHRLWAFLLVLDSVFVMVFGGVVASKVYHYWRTPAPLPPPVAHHRAPKTADGVKTADTTASTATAPAKPVEPPKPVETAKPVPKPAPKPEPVKAVAAHADVPRPPKPSMLNDPPKPRTTPTPAGATAAASAPAAVDGKTKAAPVVFRLKAPNARAVQLVGAFIVRGGRKEMSQDDDGLWTVKLYLNPGQYRYFFAVDKKKTLDPENPQSDRGASLLTIP